MIRSHFFFVLVAAITCTQAWSEELSYVGDDELSMELTARRNDMERTMQRVEELKQTKLAQQNEISNLKAEMGQVDKKLVQRTSMLYRLSKNGKCVQYLFSSDSATAFFKRIQTLRKLVTSQMDEKRELSLQLAGVSDEMARTKEQLQGARLLLEQLQAVVDNLQDEQRNRQSASQPNF